MSELTRFSQQFKLVDPKGNIQYVGAGLVLNPTEVASDETTNTAAVGEFVRINYTVTSTSVATVVIPRFDKVTAGSAPASDIPQTFRLGFKRIAAATDVGFLGVVLSDVVAGGIGVCAGVGSIVSAICLTSGSLTNNVVGAELIGSSTAGSCNATSTVAASNGIVCGMCLKPAGTATDGTVTGSATQIGAMVLPR